MMCIYLDSVTGGVPSELDLPDCRHLILVVLGLFPWVKSMEGLGDSVSGSGGKMKRKRQLFSTDASVEFFSLSGKVMMSTVTVALLDQGSAGWSWGLSCSEEISEFMELQGVFLMDFLPTMAAKS